jgi:RNA polymerase sigma-70 factor (ECF subfamily)
VQESPRKKFSGSEAGLELNEAQLLERLRSKDPAASRLFYERYAGYLTAVCLRYVPDRSDTKDILQEAFIRMFDRMEDFEFRGEGSLKAWAVRIVVNGALKNLRRKKRLQFVEDLPDLPEEEEPEVEKMPPGVIQKLIEGLPDGYRTVFNLVVFEHKSHREIAGLLGIKEDSSASQFSRARALLARQIKTYLKEHGQE